MARILSAVAILALLFTGVLFGMQERFLFFPERLPKDYDFALPAYGEEVFFDAEDGVSIHALWYRAPEEESRGVILYFHGNAGSLSSWKTVAPLFLSLDYDLFIIDYRGFGKSEGYLSEEGLYRDGRGAYLALLERGYEANQIVVLGRSIGTGIATEIASTHEVAGLILETPFTNLMDLATSHIPVLPRLLLTYRFKNDEKSSRIDVPTLVLHGDNDEVIPFAMGEELYEKLHQPKRFLRLQGARHNDITSHPEYLPGLDKFLNELVHPR